MGNRPEKVQTPDPVPTCVKSSESRGATSLPAPASSKFGASRVRSRGCREGAIEAGWVFSDPRVRWNAPMFSEVAVRQEPHHPDLAIEKSWMRGVLAANSLVHVERSNVQSPNLWEAAPGNGVPNWTGRIVDRMKARVLAAFAFERIRRRTADPQPHLSFRNRLVSIYS